MDSRTIALDSKDLEGGIEALSSAARAFRLTRFERGAYHGLMVSVYVTTWSAITLIFLAVLIERGANDSVVRYVGVPAAIGRVCGVCLATVALVLNIPLAARLYRERSRLTELGLASLSKSLWRARWRGRWTSRAFRWGPLEHSPLHGLLGVAAGHFR
jgi:hypothetical protein